MEERSIHAWTGPGGVAHLTLGDGQRHNALPPAAWPAIAAWATAPATTSAPAAVISGHGASFCSGADLRHWRDADADEVATTFDEMEAACRAIEALDVPTIAVLRGVALGAGCQLALSCDLRIADRSARIGMPIVRLGILTGSAFASRLARSTHRSVAASLLLLGEILDAEAAQQAGLVSHVVDDASLDATTERWATSLAALPAAARRAAVLALRGADSASAVPVGAPRVDPASFNTLVREVLGDA